MTDEKFKQWRIDTAKKRLEQISHIIRGSLDENEYMEWLKEYDKLRTFLKQEGIFC